MAGERAQGQRDAARASRGDAAAFSRLVEAHSALVRGVARGVLGADDAQDASQQAWIRVWRSLGRFRGDSAFTAWLYRIATNTRLDLRRGRVRREARQHGGEMPYVAEPAGGDADPEASALKVLRSCSRAPSG